MIWLLLLIALGVALAYRRAASRTALTAYALLLMAYAATGGAWSLFFVGALLLAVAGAVLLNPPLRQEWLSRPALEYFRRVMPEVSDTEQAALDAGTVWWDGELFGGRPDWSRLHGLPPARLSAEEQAFLDGPVTAFCALCDDWRITAVDRDLSPEAWAYLKHQGFFGMIIPKQYGGLGFGALAHSAVLNRIASGPGGVTAASIVAVPNSLGPAELLLHYGTDEQKQQYLPRLAAGEEIPCFALTSPWAGSDAGGIPDYGLVCHGPWQGSEVLGMRLTFDKRYITLAPVATLVGLAFKLYDPERLLGGGRELGICCALLPRDTPGLEIGNRHWPLDNPFMNGPVRGREVFVPLDFIIGGPRQIGQGWRMLMECLAAGRAISLPSNTAGQATMAALASGAYARIRRQFGLPVGAFEAVQEQLAKLGAQAYAVQAVRQLTAQAVELGEKPSVPSAIAKYYCSDTAQDSLRRAMDIHAGKGVMLGPANWLARAFQGSPVAVTVEGANLLTRGMILFGQGALRCHPYLREEIAATREPNAALALERFDTLLMAHLGHALQAGARSLVLGLTLARWGDAPGDAAMRRIGLRANRYSAALALCTELTLAALGGALKLRESLSARLGDVLIALYVVSAALRRYDQEGRPGEDLPLLQAVCDEQFLRIETALDGLLRNLPKRPLAWAGRLLVFPLGRHARAADDATGQKIAAALQQPGGLRLRLAEGLHTDAASPLGRLETAMVQAIDAEPLLRKLGQAQRAGRLQHPHPLDRIDEAREAGVLAQDESRQLRAALEAAEALCAVDEFDAGLERVLSRHA
ncbi:acyl-CoA dehydrogenase [Solimonas sp. K1W22B-7]|uniref:acyl-CoA dehydrogenase n=1 Tax=Solimonas sp. K1W22B-7 TaxID=2303331 RepID=UPI000E336A9C|nr:acyl-CoA dehydrogenase [Solimonas sp. K1W22B-7]AXQ27913.1 acyl-CoA dehydrogenase [Solimonas sp. K1W22B-7]